MTSIYLIGSLKNPKILEIGNHLRTLGFEIFDDWMAAGEIADQRWQEYEIGRGHNYKQAMRGYAAQHVFEFDLYHLQRADIGVLVLPAGRSGHLELGYMIGKGKPGFVLFDQEPETFDQMYQFAEEVFYNMTDLGEHLKREYL